MFPSEICEIFQNIFFNRAPPAAASERQNNLSKLFIFSQHSYSLMNFVEILFSNKFFIHKNYVQNIHCLALMRHD